MGNTRPSDCVFGRLRIPNSYESAAPACRNLLETAAFRLRRGGRRRADQVSRGA
jgi:hypothetical protein